MKIRAGSTGSLPHGMPTLRRARAAMTALVYQTWGAHAAPSFCRPRALVTIQIASANRQVIQAV
jgi:hypothetical protein